MKNVDEFYKKYYNAYKNDYDVEELCEAKKKKCDYKQSELFDETDKKLTLDGETRKWRAKTDWIAKVVALQKLF